MFFFIGSLGLWALPFLPMMNHGLPLFARPSTIPHNTLTELSVFLIDFICSLILYACFASFLSIFCKLFSILIMSLFDASLCSRCTFSMFLGISKFRWFRFKQLEYEYFLASFPSVLYPWLYLQFGILVSFSPEKDS